MSRTQAYAGVAVAVLMWGLSFPVGEHLAGHLSPWWLTAWRYTPAAAIVNALAFASLGRAALLPLRRVPRVALMGLFGHTLFSVCFFAGLRTTPAATAAVITGLEPAIAVGLAAVLGKTRSGSGIWSGIAVAFAGIALLAGSMPGEGQAVQTWSGPLLVLVSAASFAVYSLMCEGSLASMPPLALAAATMRWSLPPLWLALALGDAWNTPAPTDLGALTFFVLGVTVAAFLGWNHGLRTLGMAGTVIWANMVPLVAVLAAALSGQPVLPPQWCGLALVLAGVALVQARHGR